MRSAVNGLVAVIVFLSGIAAALGSDFDVPAEKIGGGSPDGMMHRYLLRQAEQALRAMEDRCMSNGKRPSRSPPIRSRPAGEVPGSHRRSARANAAGAAGHRARSPAPAIAWKRSSSRASRSIM